MSTSTWDSDWTTNYTGVGSNSLSGRLLRRYWHPVLLSSELLPRMLREVELLGQSLVLFRLLDGRLGVLPEHCPHRGASLKYGFIEQDGIRCAYHGWKFSCEGTNIETPFGPPHRTESTNSWSARAYECGGIIFICLAPEPAGAAPPRWDILLTGSDEIVVQRHEESFAKQCWDRYRHPRPYS